MLTKNLSRLALLAGAIWLTTLLVLFAISGSAPSGSSDNGTLLTWLSRHASTAKMVGWLALLNALATVAIFAVLRDLLRRYDDTSALPTLVLAGSAVYAVGLLAELGLYFAAAKSASHLTPASVGALRTAADLGQLTQDAGIAVVAAAAGIAVLLQRSLPVWLGWFGVAVAVAAAIPMLDPLGAFAFIVWTASSCIALYLRGRAAVR